MNNENNPRRQIVKTFLSGLRSGESAFAYPFAVGEIAVPFNGTTGQAYSSVNRLILTERGRSDPRWLTKRQAEELGYQVRENAEPRQLIFWDFFKEVPALNQDGSPRLNNIGRAVTEKVRRDRPVPRVYEVLHAQDLLTHDGRELPPYEAPPQEKSPSERAMAILAQAGAVIAHRPGANAADYKMSTDTIFLPEPGLVAEEEYYAQAITELVAWTGHPDRLGWLVEQKTESQQVQDGIQEVLAQAMIAQDLGLKISQPLVNSMTIKSWEKYLENDPDLLFRAAAQAENIRRYVLGLERMKGHDLDENRRERPQQGYYSQSFRPSGPDDQPELGAWIRASDDEEATVFAVVSGRDGSVVSTFDNRETSVTEAEALNLGIKPSFKYSGDIVALDVPFEEKEMVKALGATWDRRHSAWCARSGVELSKLGRWIPAHEMNRPGLIEPDLNDRLPLDVPYQQRQEAKDLGAFFDNRKGAWVTSIDNKNLAEITKKFPPIRIAEQLQEPASSLAAVPEIAMARVVLAVPFEEKAAAKAAGAKWDRDEKVWVAEPGTDLARLSQWLPEREPEPEQVLAAAEEFAKVLKEAGFQLEELPKMDGRIYRVPVRDGKPNANDGAYYAAMNGERPNGWLKNHKSGEYRSWIYSGQEMTAADKEVQQEQTAVKLRNKVEKAETLCLAKWSQGIDVAREFAAQIEGMVTTAELLKNPFLEVAGLNAVGGVRRDDDGNLLVPGITIDGRLQTIQTISPNGEAHFEKGGQRVAAMCLIDGFDLISTPDQRTGLPVFRSAYADHGDETLNHDLIVAEDFAAGASLHMATGLPVVAAFSADNLGKAAVAIRDKYPEVNILVCASNYPERPGNPGLKKAEEAARKVGGQLVVPEFSEMERRAGLGSFNDLHKTYGLEAVSQAVNKVRQQGKAQNEGLSR